MDNHEKREFMDLIKDSLAAHRIDVTPGQLRMWWEDLEPYPFAAVRQAFAQHRRTSERPPTSAAILGFLPDLLGHPSPEEAWNRLPKSEYDAGYVTSQIMQAYGACGDSLGRGDLIGARMAFLEAYRRAVAEARLTGQRAVYFYSGATGGDFEQRRQLQEKHTLEAAERGWLSHDRAQEILTGIAHDLGKDQVATVQRLGGSQQTVKRLTGSGSPEITKRLKEISALLTLTSDGAKKDNSEHIRELIEGGA